MKNVIRVTILAALTVTAALSTATVNDQPPPCCLPCLVEATPVQVAPVQVASVQIGAVPVDPQDQPPPCCLPCTVV